MENRMAEFIEYIAKEKHIFLDVSTENAIIQQWDINKSDACLMLQMVLFTK